MKTRSLMASASVAALTAFVLALQTAPLSAALQTANDAAAGNWSNNASWTLSATPAAGPSNGSPAGDDTWDVTIDSHAIVFDPTTPRTVGNLTVNGGTLSATGAKTLNVTGAFDIVSGTMSVGGVHGIHTTLTLANGFGNAGTLRVLANSGWQGNLTVGGTQTITNTGTLELTTSSGNQSPDIAITASINNQGGTVSLIKQGNTNWTPSTFPLAGATYTNSGTWTVPQYRGMTISGANATFTQSAGVLTNVGGITFSGGNGVFALNGGTLQNTGNLTISSFTQAAGAVIDGGGTITTNGVASIALNGGSASGGPTFALSPSSGVGAQLAIAAGYSYDASTIVNGGGTISGPFTVNAGRTFTAAGATGGSNPKTVVVPAFTNSGTVVVSGAGSGWHNIVSVPTGTLSNASGGTIAFVEGSGVGAQRTLDAQLANQGTLTVNAASNTSILGRAGAAHTNSGVVTLNQSLTVHGSYEQTGGTTTIATGKAMTLANGAFTLSGGTLAAAGSITTTGFSQAPGTTMSGSGGTITVTGASSIALNGGTDSGSRTYVLNTGGTTAVSQLNIDANYAYGASTRVIGNATITGPFTVNNGASFTVESVGNGTNPKLITTPAFTNEGTILIAGTGTGWGVTLSVPNGALTNASGGTIELSDVTGGSSAARNLSAELVNHGLVFGNTTSSTMTIGKTGAAHGNSGEIRVAAGRTLTFTGTSLTNNSGGTVSGTGTLNVSGVSFTNNGTLAPGLSAGTLAISGSATFGGTSLLDIELGGTGAGQYDLLTVSSTATLGGALGVSLLAPYTPLYTDSFTVLTAGTRSGTFSGLSLAPSSGLANVGVSYVGNTVVLTDFDLFPIADIQVTNLGGGSFLLDGSNSTDPDDPTPSVLDFAWDLTGDGLFADGTTPTVTHTFGGGYHTVSLRVTDDDGNSSSGYATLNFAVPEPSALMLALLGLVAATGVRRRHTGDK